MTRSPLLLSCCLVATAASASTVPHATPAGVPINCVQIRGIDRTVVRDDRTIDFFMRGRTVYRNVLPQSCPELGFEQAFSYRTSQSELCNVDIITVFRHVSPIREGPSCGLGSFQPVTLDAK